jgi:outer membrane protein assembly factor BamE (lipoprotein component of BamABCDE complex)
VKKQTTLIVRFDQKGNVTAVQNTGKELVMNVRPSGRETPVLGRQRSFFEELFGNIGSVGAPGLPGQGNRPQ